MKARSETDEGVEAFRSLRFFRAKCERACFTLRSGMHTVTLRTLSYGNYGILYSLVWVMQDLYHQP